MYVCVCMFMCVSTYYLNKVHFYLFRQHYENLQGSAAIRERYASNLTIEAM